MIFAELDYPTEYWEIHEELKQYLSARFPHVESGIQCDSWFRVHDGGQTVAIDTFSSMKHQVKAAAPGPHVQRVIEALQEKYAVRVLAEPQREEHEF